MTIGTESIVKFFPLVVAALTMFTFVLPAKVGVRAKARWAMVLLACASRGIVYASFGSGSARAPDLPQWLLWFWDWACSGLYLLFLLSLVWWVRRGRLVVLPVLAWGLAALGMANVLMLPTVREAELAYPDLPAELDGYRIVQLSDLHCCASMRGWRTRGIVERVNACNPDLICLTGDYVDGYVAQLADDLAPLRDLRARDGVYAIRGNHEYFLDYAAWRAWFDANGFRFLVNECVFPRRSLALGGVNDPGCVVYGDVFPNVAKAFAAATNGEFRVLLEHQPNRALDNFVLHGTRLQLSGHTHGGIAPGLGFLVSLKNGARVRGAYRMPGGGFLHVSPGVGQWAGLPFRFFDPPEISLIVLRRTDPQTKGDSNEGSNVR